MRLGQDLWVFLRLGNTLGKGGGALGGLRKREEEHIKIKAHLNDKKKYTYVITYQKHID